MQILTNTFSFALVIGFLIFIHELGHFTMAKLLKIRVNIFSLGFGPKIFGFTLGETEYRFSLFFFLGGYVSMEGEEPEEELKGSKEEFLSRSKFERFLVLIMGPATNLFVAFLFMSILYWTGTKVPAFREAPAVIGFVQKDSPAEKAGLLPGDLVLEIDNREISKYSQFEEKFLINPNRTLKIRVERNGSEVNLEIVPQSSTVYKIGNAGVSPVQKFELAKVEKGLPADLAGLKTGDIITEINGEKIYHFLRGMEIIADSVNQENLLKVKRGDKFVNLSITPESRIFFLSELERAAFYVYPKKVEGYDRKVPVVRETALPEGTNLKEGDIITSLKGQTINDYDEFRNFVEEQKPTSMKMGISREGKELEVTLVSYEPEIKGYIGIVRKDSENETIKKQFGFLEGMRQSVKLNLAWGRTLVETVKNLFTGVLSMRAMSGPIDIAKFSGNALREGMLMNFIAFVSFNLGIMNLLPIPVLDGGHIFIIFIEGIIRRDLSLKLKEKMMQVGFFALITLMVVVLSFDLLKNIPFLRDSFL